MNRKIKPLFIIPDIVMGGNERVTLNLLRHLDPSIFESTLLLLNQRGDLWDELPAGIKCVAALPETATRYRHNMPRLLSQTIYHSLRSDIIIGAKELWTTYFALAGGAVARKPVVGWVHTNVDYLLPKMPSWHSKALRLTYPRLNKVIFVSSGTATSLQKLTHVTAGQTSIIYNPIESEEIVAKSKEPLPEWASSVYAKPVVLAVGRLSIEKGFDLLIRAHAKLKTAGLDHHLLILGEGSERDEIEKLTGSLGVTESVFMPGSFVNPYPFFKSSRVLALTSHHEALPSVLIEALALGTPVVAVDCPSGPAEILECGRYGRLVTPRNPDALAEGICTLLTNPTVGAQYMELGYQRAQDFHPKNVVPQWERLLQELAAPKSAYSPKVPVE